MKLTTILSTLCLSQAISAKLTPSSSAGEYLSGLYNITFPKGSLPKAGTIDISTNLGYGDANENFGLIFEKGYHRESDNLNLQKDIKINDLSVRANFTYNGDGEDAFFELRAYSSIQSTVFGTYVQFNGAYQAYGDGGELADKETFSVNAEIK